MTTAVHIAAHATEALLFSTLLQLTVLVLAARVGGGIALRMRQFDFSHLAGRCNRGVVMWVALVLGFFLFSWFDVRPVMNRILHHCDAGTGNALAQPARHFCPA